MASQLYADPMSKISRYAGWLALLCLVLLAPPPAALAHSSTPTTSSIAWTTWSWNPWVVGSLILAACLYRRGGRALWCTATRERGVHRREGAPLSWRPSADAVAGNGGTLSYSLRSPSAHAVAGKSVAFWSG